jgi:parallel beta-helix repeat protein
LKGKAVSDLMFALLFIGMLTLAFNVQPVRATLYIGTDYAFTGNIYDEIVVTGDNIVIDGGGYTLQGTGGGTGIDLTDRSNVTVKNTEITAFAYGIHLERSSGNIISENNIMNSTTGIRLSYSSDNILSRNILANNLGRGIQLSA